MPKILDEMKQARALAARQLEVLEFQVTSARRRVEEWDERIARSKRRRASRVVRRPSKAALSRHALAEVDDDGLSRDARSYRYVCRCGKPGTWQPSRIAAKGQHDVHRTDAAKLDGA
jgi:hypothetical protein